MPDCFSPNPAPVAGRPLSRPALAALLLPWMGAAVAACPQTLGPGVTVVYADEVRAHHTSAGAGGLMRERVTFGDTGEGYEMLSWHGLYPVEESDFGPDGPLEGSELRTVYDRPPPAPGPDGSAIGIDARLELPGGDAVARRLDLVTGPLAELGLGDCRYPAFAADLSLTQEDDSYTLRYQVIPALGIAVLTGWEDAHESGLLEPVLLLAGDGT